MAWPRPALGGAVGGQEHYRHMYTVYIIQSKKVGKFYVGYTSNIVDRIQHHNSRANKSTRPYVPWEIIYQEHFPTKKEAWLRERQIKAYKGGNAFKKLVNNGGVA